MHCMCLCVQNLCYILFKYYIKHKSLSLSLSLSLPLEYRRFYRARGGRGRFEILFSLAVPDII